MGPTTLWKNGSYYSITSKPASGVISVDSALLEGHIGMAKPSKEEFALAPHRLIDIFKIP